MRSTIVAVTILAAATSVSSAPVPSLNNTSVGSTEQVRRAETLSLTPRGYPNDWGKLADVVSNAFEGRTAAMPSSELNGAGPSKPALLDTKKKAVVEDVSDDDGPPPGFPTIIRGIPSSSGLTDLERTHVEAVRKLHAGLQHLSGDHLRAITGDPHSSDTLRRQIAVRAYLALESRNRDMLQASLTEIGRAERLTQRVLKRKRHQEHRE